MYQLNPKAKWLFFWRNSGGTFLACIFLSIYIIPQITNMSSGNILGKIILWLIIFFLIFGILSYIIASLQYKYYKFELAEDVFRAESGVIHKRYVSIPYERIQNVDIHRNLLARMLGLSEVLIQTAGYSAVGRRGGGSEGKLPGLSPEDAEKVRDALIQMAKGKRNQGL